ncbi:MAG: hypothetical protein JO199_09400 [Candidatus Eremiobacteraeota bacterium]|nr:hypothetical protein [Candidatus Eremiobacteraeota bacterium]
MIVRDDEYLDFSKVPESKGVPPFLYRVIVVGILCIFAVGASCVFTAGYGHMWPSAQSQRPDLGNMHEGTP